MKLTILIPTYNCESLIEDCIKSVVDIAGEILIADSFSTDGTLEICKRYGARVIQRQYNYSAAQKNWAIPQAKNEWVLLLDSDERATEELKKEIEGVLSDEKKLEGIDGFEIARRHYFLDKWLRFGGRYPLYNVRLFRKSCRYEDRDVHAHILLPKSRMRKLKGDILHFSDRNLEQILEKVNRYSTYQANYMAKKAEKKTNVSFFRSRKVSSKEFFTNFLIFKSVIKDVWFHIPFSPFWRFLYMYIFQFGFLDGREGFLIAMLYSFEDFVSKNKYKLMTRKERETGWMMRWRLSLERFGYEKMEVGRN